VKLLLDQNLAPRLVGSLAEAFPGSRHVTELGLARASDADVWEHARDNGFTIASKDSDFQQLSFLYGAPPKVIWIRRGNCSVAEIERLLQTNVDLIREFEGDAEAAYLILS